MKNSSAVRSAVLLISCFGLSSSSLQAMAKVPASVEKLLDTPSLMLRSDDQEKGVRKKQPLIYVNLKGDEADRFQAFLSDHPDLEISAHKRDGVTTFIVSENAVNTLASQQQQSGVSWLESNFPGVIHMGVVNSGGEEPDYEVESVVRMTEEDIPLSFPEADWLGMGAFWQGLNIQGKAITTGVLDSGFKSIVPDGFNRFRDPDFVSKYRLHAAFGAKNNGKRKSVTHRASSPELSNPFYGDPDNGSEKKQYHIVGLRSGHGTQVSCAATGGYVNDDANGISAVPRGASYGASLVFDFAGDETVQIDPATGEYVDKATALATTMDSLAWISQQGIDALNYSFGHGNQYAQAWDSGVYEPTAIVSPYSTIAREFDRAAYLNDFLFFKSAGNRSLANDPYAFSITEPADNYNGISVGNMNPYYVEGGDDDLTVLKPRSEHHLRVASTRGPTLDGRRKPDVVAPGSYVVSCTVPYIDDERDDYRPTAEARPVTGTSIASPLAEGVAGLVKEALLNRNTSEWNISEHAPRYSMAVKSIMINSAENRTPTEYEAGEHEGGLGDEKTIWPDPSNAHWNNGYGYGYLDASVAAKQYGHVIQDAVGLKETKYYQVMAPARQRGDVKVTLTWEKRFPADHENKMYDYGYPLTPLQISLEKSDRNGVVTPLATDTSLIDSAMTQHVINGTAYDYAANPWDTEEIDYTSYNNVLQVSGKVGGAGNTCVKVSVVPDQIRRIRGANSEPFAIASSHELKPVKSCS